MFDAIRNIIIWRILKVPPKPDAPAGATGSVQIFRAAEGFYKLQLFKWVLRQIGPAIGLIVGLAFLAGLGAHEHGIGQVFYILEIVGIIMFLLQLPITLLMVKLNYEYRWYIITDRSLRIREGLAEVKEKTMSFANIQNLSIHQGPLQRILGIQDLQVRTAGGGGGLAGAEGSENGGESLHLAYFRGVNNAEEIRDLIRHHLEKIKDSGLGDPDEDHDKRESGEADHIDAEVLSAAEQLLDEVRRLRRTLS